ncbi:MAG: hypothetical protein ABFD54_01025 [Armatimonadota bacterium]|nr:hypothetical protein [bacterium]
MTLKTHTKSRLMAFVDQNTLLGLRIGIPVIVVAAGYLVSLVIGQRIQELPKMGPADREYFNNSLIICGSALMYSGLVVVASLILRFFTEERLGQILAVAGAVFYFGGPALVGKYPGERTIEASTVLAAIVADFLTVGAICLVPGLVLIVRDCILRIWRGISVRRVLESRWGDEAERAKKSRKPKIYGKCWDMLYCRGFVRRVCPAWQEKKPCWRLKVGCYCDEHTILKAMASQGTDNASYRGIMQSLGLDKPGKESRVSAKIKRARCRRCGIYGEHQRQKYRILSPMVFPAVVLMMYLFYDDISKYVWMTLDRTDKLFRFLAYRHVEGYSLGADGHVLTNIAIVWLTIIIVSYALRTIEYLIFDLQV